MFFWSRTHGTNVICWNALQEIQTIKSTFKQGKYLSLFILRVSDRFFAMRILLSLNVRFNKNIERMIFNTCFVSVHGKDLVEEIKSETSGDLQTTLVKLAEVWDTIISQKCGSCRRLRLFSHYQTKLQCNLQHLLTVHHSVFHRVREVPQRRSTRILLMRMPTNFLRLAPMKVTNIAY